MLRREVLAGLLACASLPARAQGSASATEEPGLQLGAAEPFQPTDLRELARRLAASPHVAPARIPEEWTGIDYDQYRAIWFDGRNALWQSSGQEPFRVDMFPPGLYFPTPIRVDVVEDGAARPVLFDMGVFDRTDRKSVV